MGEPALFDPSPFDLPAYPFDPDLAVAGDEFLLADDFSIPGVDEIAFDFDGADFSIDDLLLSPPPEAGDFSGDPPDFSSSSAAAAPTSPESGSSSAASAVTAHEVKNEVAEEPKSINWALKRKKGKEEHFTNHNFNSDASKCRRSDGESSPSASRVISEEGVDGEDPRKVARLVRNRESAQLSRQRKKRYIEELEEKVKSMHSVINDLNTKISYVMAENATLKQQLGTGGNSGPGQPIALGVYPPPGMQFPWVPGYALRPHGTPLVPIPRLKTQQPAVAVKAAKKVESKKVEGKGKSKAKTKKVASVSLIGLLFVMLVFGAVVPGLNIGLGRIGGDDDKIGENGEIGQPYGRVLRVVGGINSSEATGLEFDGKFGNDGGGGGSGGVDNGSGQKGQHAQNSSETLPALLYVPRNGKHVKINGNLIIHSVLASEKAVAHSASEDQVKHKETSYAVAPYLGKDMDHHGSAPVDAPLPQWFREGMAGPMLSSGMCTEVFQFDVSPASTYPSGIIPASSIVNSSVVNATEKLPKAARNGRIKNRRIMYNEAIPLTGKTLNNSEPFEKPSESRNLRENKPHSSVVVSVLADPREAGDGDGNARISPKPLSKIFVVVLLDGVKYVTYSCMLPFKSSGPHLVN